VREVLNRAAIRRGFDLVYCARRPIPGLDATDDRRSLRLIKDETVDTYLERELAATAASRPLLVTRDIPLAERVLEIGVDVMNDRGTRFDPGMIAHRRSLRDAAASIRTAGLETMPRGSGYREADKKAFADALDRYLTARLNPR
jgi:hypothetical protein